MLRGWLYILNGFRRSVSVVPWFSQETVVKPISPASGFCVYFIHHLILFTSLLDMDDQLLSVFNLPIVTLQYKNVVFGPILSFETKLNDFYCDC